MGYKAVSRIKLDANEYLERGDEVTESDIDDLEALVAAGVIMSDEDFDNAFPEYDNGGANQAWGTPSNLEQIEGSELQVNPPAEGSTVPSQTPPTTNPANVRPVEGAVNPGSSDDEDEDEDDES